MQKTNRPDFMRIVPDDVTPETFTSPRETRWSKRVKIIEILREVFKNEKPQTDQPIEEVLGGLADMYVDDPKGFQDLIVTNPKLTELFRQDEWFNEE